MRAFLFITLLTLIVSCNAPGDDKPVTADQHFGFPGTDKTEIANCSAGTAYVYEDYVIYTVRSEGFPGYDIYIYETAGKPADPCSMDIGKAYYTITAKEAGGSNFFSGIYKDYLFIDRGTGPSHRVMTVFDIKSKRFLIFTSYSDASVREGVLTYWDTLPDSARPEEKIPCPEAGEWKKQGFEVIYERKETLDLEAGIKRSSSKYRCSPAQ